MCLLQLTQVISEEALCIFLEGFERKTKLTVSIYVDSEVDIPIFNRSQMNKICNYNRQEDNKQGCLFRNSELANKVLLENDEVALKKLRTCPIGFEHWAEVIKPDKCEKPIAVMYFGGVSTDQIKLGRIYNNYKDILNIKVDELDKYLMAPNDFQYAKNQFRNYALNIKNYCDSHINLMSFAEDKTLLTTDRLSSILPPFIESIDQEYEDIFNNILKFLNQQTKSRLSALCIYEGAKIAQDHQDDILVVRSVVGIEELEKEKNKKLYGPEIFKLKESVIGEAILNERPQIISDIVIDKFVWRDAIEALGAKRVLALPLITSAGEKVGGLICFPERDIWISELNGFETFTRKIASIVHLAIQNELNLKFQNFREKLRHITNLTGNVFYNEMANLINETMNASATSMFILDKKDLKVEEG